MYSNSCSSYQPLTPLLAQDVMPTGGEAVVFQRPPPPLASRDDTPHGCLPGLRSALGRCLGRWRAEGHTAYYRPALTDARRTEDNIYQPLGFLALHQTPAEIARSSFEAMAPNPGQRKEFNRLMEYLQSATNPASSARWLEAMDHLMARMLHSESLRAPCENERRNLREHQALRQLCDLPNLGPYEHTQFMAVDALIDASQNCQAEHVAGHEVGLEFLRTARHCVNELLRDHLPPAPKRDRLAGAIEKALGDRKVPMMPRSQWALVGCSLKAWENLGDMDAVLNALAFTEHCLVRMRNRLLPAIASTRLLERLSREGAPRDKAARAASLLEAGGCAGLDDLMMVARRLCMCEMPLLDTLARSPLMLFVCHDAVTTFLPTQMGMITSESAQKLQSAAPMEMAHHRLRYYDEVNIFCAFAQKVPGLFVALVPESLPLPDMGACASARRRLPPDFDHALAKAAAWAQTWAEKRAATQAGSSRAVMPGTPNPADSLGQPGPSDATH